MIRGNRRRSGLQSDVLALYRKVLRSLTFQQYLARHYL